MEKSLKPDTQHDGHALLGLVDTVIRELQPGAQLRAGLDSQFERDLGLDSLARVELLARVERSFGVRFPDDTLAKVETPRQLLAALEFAGHRCARPCARARWRWRGPTRSRAARNRPRHWSRRWTGMLRGIPIASTSPLP